MTAAPLRLEIQLCANLNAACACDQVCAASGAAVSFSLSNVEFIGEYLQLSDSAIYTIVSGSDSPLQWVAPGFANYQFTQTLGASTTMVNIPVAAKYSSLKALMTSVRNSQQGVATQTYYPFSSHPFTINQAYWRVGSNVLPSKPLTTNEEIFIETLKVFGSLSDQLYQPAIDVESFTLAAPVVATQGEPNGTGASSAGVGSGAFVVGVDLEVFAGSDRDAMFQGINTNTDDIFVVLQFASANITSARFDTYAL